jgi:hypothetical protein
VSYLEADYRPARSLLAQVVKRLRFNWWRLDRLAIFLARD